MTPAGWAHLDYDGDEAAVQLRETLERSERERRAVQSLRAVPDLAGAHRSAAGLPARDLRLADGHVGRHRPARVPRGYRRQRRDVPVAGKSATATATSGGTSPTSPSTSWCSSSGSTRRAPTPPPRCTCRSKIRRCTIPCRERASRAASSVCSTVAGRSAFRGRPGELEDHAAVLLGGDRERVGGGARHQVDPSFGEVRTGAVQIVARRTPSTGCLRRAPAGAAAAVRRRRARPARAPRRRRGVPHPSLASASRRSS